MSYRSETIATAIGRMNRQYFLPAIQRELIVNALGAMNGNYAKAAKLLGITRSTLRKRDEKFEINEEFTVR